MSSVSLPVTRPTGRALLVGSVDYRERPLGLLQDIGFICVEADDPYSAMAELSQRPQAYRAMILSLQSVFQEELPLIATVKGRFPHIEIWVTDTDGRQAALAEAMCFGADGLLADDGLHRVAVAAAAPAALSADGAVWRIRSTWQGPPPASRQSGQSTHCRFNTPPGRQADIAFWVPNRTKACHTRCAGS